MGAYLGLDFIDQEYVIKLIDCDLTKKDGVVHPRPKMYEPKNAFKIV